MDLDLCVVCYTVYMELNKGIPAKAGGILPVLMGAVHCPGGAGGWAGEDSQQRWLQDHGIALCSSD